MDRSINLPNGTAVVCHRTLHIVGRNCVDLLAFRCGISAWRHDLSDHEGEALCKNCHDESFIPWYDKKSHGEKQSTS